MKEKLFYYSISFFIIGIFLASWKEDISWDFLFFPLLILAILWIFLYQQQKPLRIISLVLISLLFFSFGAMYYQDYYFGKKGLSEDKINTQIRDIFIVDEEPEQKDYKQKIIVKSQYSPNRFIIWTDKLPIYTYGDELSISGWLLKIQNFDEKFDYINFLKKEDIFYEIKGAKINLLRKHQNFWLKEYLYTFKQAMISQLKRLMPEPESSLLAGILIGAKENLNKELLEDFRKTGIIHIVVLSGYNLSILAKFLMIILSFLGKRISTILGSLSIILFALMTGASATILRASIMALLIILADRMGRNAEAIKLLFFAAFVMLLFNPMLLFYDPSFQLSFLATLGLLLLGPKIEKLLKYGNWKFLNLREILAATLAAQIFVSPLILYMMDTFSLIAPLVNILVIAFIPISMSLGVLSLIISTFSFNSALILSYLNYIILQYDILMVQYFADFKYSILEIEDFSADKLFITYAIYFIIYIFWIKRKKK